MVEGSLLEQFFASVGHSPWSVVIGFGLLLLVGVLRFLLNGKTKGAVTEWVSVSSAVVVFVAGSLVSGGLWYVALAFGLFASPASEGFWKRVRKSIPVIGATIVLLLLVGCGAGPIIPDPRPGDGVEPCAAERALVEGLDDAVGAVDAVLPDDAPKANEGLSYARGGVEQGLAAVAACEALTSEGRSGLSAVLPWITVAGHVVRGLMAILMAAGVDLPDALTDVLHSLGLARAAPPIEREAPYAPAYIDVAVAR